MEVTSTVTVIDSSGEWHVFKRSRIKSIRAGNVIIQTPGQKEDGTPLNINASFPLDIVQQVDVDD